MSLIGLDQFTGTPGDTWTNYAAGWVSVSGITGVGIITADGQKATTNATGGTIMYCRTDFVPPSADYIASMDVLFTSLVVNGPAIGIMVGASVDAVTNYDVRFVCSGSGNGTWQLRRTINNSVTTLASAAGTQASGQLTNIKLARSGNNLKVYLDNAATPLFDYTDVSASAITATGYAGIRGLNATSSRMQVDNFTVETVGAASVTTTATPARAQLTVAGFAPAVTRTANQAVSPSLAALEVRGHAPSITQTAGKATSPGTASLAVRGYAPTIARSANQTIAPGTASLSVRGYAPAITQSGPRVVSPPAGALAVRGFAPTISQASSIVPRIFAQAGMRATVTARSVALTAALSRGAALSASCASSTSLRRATLSRSAALGSGVINRTGNFP